MPPETIAALTQFGVAGLIGWMWLSERRAAADRDRQLSAAHERLIEERARLDILISALESNTRAITALEVGQRQMVEVFRSDLKPHASMPSSPKG